MRKATADLRKRTVRNKCLANSLASSYTFDGGGAFIWAMDHFEIAPDATQTPGGMPNLTDLSGRDTWDSGLTLSSGLAIRF
jgi:hypothetical protein